MDWVRVAILVSWAVVFAGWVQGISRPSPRLIRRIEDPWRCRLFGITALCIALVSAYDLGSLPVDLDSHPLYYWPLWVLFLAGPVLYYWARLALDGSWSSEAQVSEATVVVSTGPYRFLRHPIYFSKTLMAFTSAAILADWIVLALGFLLLATAVYQARIEESLMAVHLPEYREYQKKVRMLLPGWPLRRAVNPG